jgi:beta-N-acetylhexosaminidase
MAASSLRSRSSARRPSARRAALVGVATLTAGCATAASSPTPPLAPGVLSQLPPGPLDVNRALTADEQEWVERTLASLSLRDRIAQLVTVWVLGDYTNYADSSFVTVRRWIERDHVGGVVMSLGSPLEVAAKINAMQGMALALPSHIPLLVSCDIEPGLGRLEGGIFTPQLWSAGTATVLPSNMAIGADGTELDAEAAGRVTGREARAIGIHVAFAPVVDVNNNPANPVINVRSFGEDPDKVAKLSVAFIKGLQREGVAAVAKHFPGHGDTDADSHTSLPVVRSDRARLDSVELVPFRAAIAAGISGVMTAHIALPAVERDSTPATLSPHVMTGLLRDTLGFKGITFTDAMTMEGIGKGYTIDRSGPLAVEAGDDVLLMPTDVPKMLDAIEARVKRGEISRERIDASVRRLLSLKVRTGAVARPLVSLDVLREVVGAPAHWNAANEIARRAITLVRDSANLVPSTSARTIAAIVYAPETEPTTGMSLVAELRAGGRTVRDWRITPRNSPASLDSIAAAAQQADRIVVMTYTRTFEGNGRLAIPAHVASWIDGLASSGRLVVVAGGNPYVIRQFPHVGTYLVNYGRGEALERASARAILGRAPITGRAPISLPGFFKRGDGIQREVAP